MHRNEISCSSAVQKIALHQRRLYRILQGHSVSSFNQTRDKVKRFSLVHQTHSRPLSMECESDLNAETLGEFKSH